MSVNPNTSEAQLPHIIDPSLVNPDGTVTVPDLTWPALPDPPLENITTLPSKLAAKSTANGVPKTAADFAYVDQSDVDDWNAFMRLSARYHWVGTNEKARLQAYMGNVEKEFRRSVKGEEPQTPEVTFRKDFLALGLQPAVDWNDYYRASLRLAEDLRRQMEVIRRLRKQALDSEGAQRAKQRGIFMARDWGTHEEQILAYLTASWGAETKENEIEMYWVNCEEEKQLYDQDPKGYRWKDPKKLWRKMKVSDDGVTRTKIIRLPDPRERKPIDTLYTDEEWEAHADSVRERNEAIVRPLPMEVSTPLMPELTFTIPDPRPK